MNDAQLAALATSGKILNDTLVWREGMDNWRMYGEVRRRAPVPLARAAPRSACRPGPRPRPGGLRRVRPGFQRAGHDPVGGVHVCAGCKPVFMQKLAEGAKVNTGTLNYAGFWIRVGAKTP